MFIFSPFLFLYSALFMFFKYFQEFKVSPKLLNLRQYNNYARLKLRNFNELQHEFDKRLNDTIEIADNFLNLFNNKLISIIASFFSFITGSILSIMTILLLINENIFNGGEFLWGKNGSWLVYMAIFGTLFSIFNSLVIKSENSSFFESKKATSYYIKLKNILKKEPC